MFFKKVLMATDFSRPAMQMIDCLDEFQTLGLEEVILVHVIDSRSPGSNSRSLHVFEQEILDGLKADIGAMGLEIKVIITIGIPNFEIVRLAEEEQVSLILISSHGRGFIKNILLGSTTNNVIRTTSVPVLIEKYKDVDKETCRVMCLEKFKKVLIPLDLSVHSLKLLEEIQGISHLCKEVVILTVIEGAYDAEELDNTIITRLARLQEKQKYLEELGLKSKIMIRQGSASTEIITVAEKEDITLIMLASRGEGLIKNLLLGSTAHAVIQGSKRPVLLIPSTKQ